MIPKATRATEEVTDGFFDLAELLELLAQGAIVGMPSKSSVKCQWQTTSRGGGTYPMNSFDMMRADSNTERSQYKHSGLKQCAQYKAAQNRMAKGTEELLRKCGLAREEPIAALMQVTGSNVRNEHLVLCAPGCIGVDGASDLSIALEKDEVGCRRLCRNEPVGGAEIVKCVSKVGRLVGQRARHK